MKHILMIALLGLACACSGPSEGREVEPLPFHVAVRMNEVLELPVEAGQEEGPTFQLSQTGLAEAIEAQLRGYGATEVTVLQESQGSVQDDPKWWVDQARAAGADVMLDCRVSYRRQYQSARNDKFWLNLPLFLLVGTLNLFIDDRDYTTEARMAARAIDLHSVYADRADLSSSRVQFFSFDEQFENMTMDFIDRDGHKGATMFYSFFVPSGFLATETPAVSEKLEVGVTSDLARRLVRFLEDRRRSLIRADTLYPYWIDIDGWTARRAGGELEVQGQVFMQVDEFAPGMKSWAVRSAGATLSSGDFAPGEYDEENSLGGTSVLKYPLDIRVPSPSGQENVQLTLIDANDFSRSFTLGIDREPVTIEEN